MRGIGLLKYGNTGDVLAGYEFSFEIATTHSDYGTFPFINSGLKDY